MNFLENSCYDQFNQRIADLEGWMDGPVDDVGMPINTNLNTNHSFGAFPAVAAAVNITNGRVNDIADRVNSIQSALVSKGLMAA
jgi:hypothetical protein